MTTRTAGHTPLPWEAEGSTIVPLDGVGGCIAEISGDTVEQRAENVALVLRACNRHDDLVAALDAVVMAADKCRPLNVVMSAAVDGAKATLAKAGLPCLGVKAARVRSAWAILASRARGKVGGTGGWAESGVESGRRTGLVGEVNGKGTR